MAIDDSFFFSDDQVAQRLKSARQRFDLTLEQLSALTKSIDPTGAGVSRVALSRYENGATLPGLRELRLISFATRRPLSVLIYGERIDPMSSYKLELEMRIRDMVMDAVYVDGLVKDSVEHVADSEEHKRLVESVKNPI